MATWQDTQDTSVRVWNTVDGGSGLWIVAQTEQTWKQKCL